VGHNKHATLYGTTTPAFLDGFQHFVHCTNKNSKKYSIGELQNLQRYHNCVSTLPEKI